MKQLTIPALILLIAFAGCKRQSPDDKTLTLEKNKTATELQQQADSTFRKNEYMVLGVLYHQQAAEYRALCYQAYNTGRMMLDKDLADKQVDKHRIIVLDVDETVLDNSPYQAECILKNINYPTRWDEWCQKASAEAVPGSLEFLNYAKGYGVSIFYVTNRKDHLKDVTIKNLQKLGFPNADPEHVITRTTDNSKEGRRKALVEKYHISLLFGDNLGDFSYLFDEKPNAARSAAVDDVKNEFGKRFIVLPNSMYGDWEPNLYGDNIKGSDSLKSVLRLKGLKGF